MRHEVLLFRMEVKLAAACPWGWVVSETGAVIQAVAGHGELSKR